MSKLLSNGQIANPVPLSGVPLFRLAFRPFFLLGAIFSLISLSLWAATLAGFAKPALYGGAIWWHVHEMLFGFVAAIVTGFLLTAVQTWTGVPGIRSVGLASMVFLWLAARVGLVFGELFPHSALAFIDLMFLPVVATVLARSVIMVKQWRNIIFVPVLLLMSAVNAVMHWSAATGDTELLTGAGRVMVLLLVLLMSVVAGRVVPMFTANGTGTDRVPVLPWLETACITSMVLVVLAQVAAARLPAVVVTAIFLGAALVHTVRVLRWRFWVTLRTPLVWSLHLSYWCIPLGLLLYGLSGLQGVIVTHTQGIHTLTVGGVGLMILAMISRVSLGHTGRPIAVGRVMTLAFLSLSAAFIVRVFGSHFIASYQHMIFASVGLWLFGYGCFVVLYLPVLGKGRVDGRPG